MKKILLITLILISCLVSHSQQVAATAATTGTIGVAMGVNNVYTITPTGACTFNAVGGVPGERCTFVITTSGVSAFVLTWGTGFFKTGTLSTGTVSARKFAITFVYDGASWVETSRTTAQN